MRRSLDFGLLTEHRTEIMGLAMFLMLFRLILTRVT